jgi:DNA-binding NtrC family response regulator
MNNPKILVVDDEQTLRAAMFRIFSRRDYHVITTGNIREAESVITSNSELELAIVDVKLPDGDGIDLLSTLRQKYNNIPVIVLTGFASIDVAVKATRLGAFHFMTKPFNIEELISIVDKALSHKKLVSENTSLKTRLQTKYQFDNIVGKSTPITSVLNMVEKVADTDSTILITGESGTGKELFAKAIHYNSSRSDRAFIPINCGAIPSELLESELFGHVKGAFTGAISNRQGRFELANKGTLFLDEIGDLNPSLQVKLLRVLQERRFEPVGSAKAIESDVRIIAATNVDLAKAVKEGRFREDLFYRLNVIPMNIPSLRERQEDIPLLLEHFIQKFNQHRGINISGIHPLAMDKLIQYTWPGNIRELENFIERVSILRKEGIIELCDIPHYFEDQQGQPLLGQMPMDIPENGIDFNNAIAAYENQLILNALKKTGWNRNQAALLLRLNRTTLVEKIKKKGLRQDEISL